MSSSGRKETLRGYQRRKNFDLNIPAIENVTLDQEGPSHQYEVQEVQVRQQGQPLPPATIDVEALDDDVVESSPRSFAEAKSKRNRGRVSADVVVLESDGLSRVAHTNPNKRRRGTQQQTIINCEYINLDSNSNSTNVVHMPPAPPKEITFNCPICLNALDEEMSTKCGHIFCKKCIKAAIAAQGKCPTCRKKVTERGLIRVFLPATNS